MFDWHFTFSLIFKFYHQSLYPISFSLLKMFLYGRTEMYSVRTLERKINIFTKGKPVYQFIFQLFFFIFILHIYFVMAFFFSMIYTTLCFCKLKITRNNHNIKNASQHTCRLGVLERPFI